MRLLPLALVVVHFFVCVGVVMAIIGAGYRFAEGIPGAGSVDSVDQMYKLGRGYWWAVFGLAVCGVLDFCITVPAVVTRRRWAWIVPTVGIVVSILLYFVAVASFEVPPPDLGG